MADIEDKLTRLFVQGCYSFGSYIEHLEDILNDLSKRNIVHRIWCKDHTVWKSSPHEIVDRLGWLTATDCMRKQTTVLSELSQEVREAGFQHVVLLGMGGSSIGPEVLRRTFGIRNDYPELTILDSTLPTSIFSVSDIVDLRKTLFLVSSKSGDTIEPNVLYRHFRRLVNRMLGNVNDAGQRFVAVTNTGTPLEKLANREGFRRIFLNPLDIGGRFSVLSYFGLLPAALMGLDIMDLLVRADGMRDRCLPDVTVYDNPGAILGATIGGLAQKGRDKLTLVTSPSIEGFGLWLEQLIAESMGKDGLGIVPVVDEPWFDVEHYGKDRLFVHVRLDGDCNDVADKSLRLIESYGHPVVRLDLRDLYDLGAEFYRWEFAMAVSGSILGVHPFDQPNVQQAKDLTAQTLDDYRMSGRMPNSVTSTFQEILSKIKPGDYLALLVYVRQTPEVDKALLELRRKITISYGIPTTVGYGPRYLHCAGQLHKGGPGTGLYLQITAEHEKDLAVPGAEYTFGLLADAQAEGDLQALLSMGRRTARVHLESANTFSIMEFVDNLLL